MDTGQAEAPATDYETEEDSKKTPKRKRPRGRVHVFDNWCKGCGICIAFCPQEVFETGEEGRPLIAHPEKCTACRWCETHCPDLAIVVTKIDEEAD